MVFEKKTRNPNGGKGVKTVENSVFYPLFPPRFYATFIEVHFPRTQATASLPADSISLSSNPASAW